MPSDPGRPVVFAERGFRLQVPVAVASGNLEQLTPWELSDHLTDVVAEVRRRGGEIKTNPDDEIGWTWELTLPAP